MTSGRSLDQHDLIYDWNRHGDSFVPSQPVELDDETLRDGLQSPSVLDPPIEKKIRILRLMDSLGIDTADLGLPGAGARQVEHVEAMCREIVASKLRVRPNCAARTVIRDIQPIVDISQRVGIPIEACLFIGSSPIRQYTEGWTLDDILNHTKEAVRFSVGNSLPTMFVTEDTSRAKPEDIRRLYLTAIECGARRICVCDTVGHSTPEGVGQLIGFVRSLVEESGEKVAIDWHGHKDRGLSVVNCLAAIRAGAQRVHGAAIGIGERAGNAPMELILVNLKLLGWIDRDLHNLAEYCEACSEACGVPIPSNYAVVGTDAFETGTGVHAAAVIKAYKKGDAWLADRVYSGVPAGDFGLAQKIRVGPMSGKSNVIWWLEHNGFDPTDERVERIFEAAKSSSRLLEDDDLRSLASGEAAGGRPSPAGETGQPGGGE
jgi:2-isopropylmalate synthase